MLTPLAGILTPLAIQNHLALSSITDSFNRADSTTLGTSASGHVWTLAQGGPIQLLSNEAYSIATGQSIAVVTNTGFSTGRIKFKVAGTTSVPSTGGVFRYSNTNNFFVLYANGTTLILDRFVAGGFLRVANSITATAQGDVIEALVSSTSIAVYKNSTLINTYTNSELNTNTGWGIRLFTGNASSPARLDDFSVIPS